jgi:hypothetical protein
VLVASLLQRSQLDPQMRASPEWRSLSEQPPDWSLPSSAAHFSVLLPRSAAHFLVKKSALIATAQVIAKRTPRVTANALTNRIIDEIFQ